MKKRFFSMLCLIATAVAAMAQSWTAPVAPTQPSVTGGDMEAGAAYYILNVETGQFLTAANLWATRISLSEDGVPYMQVMVEALGEGEQETYPDGYKMRLNGTFYFNGPQPNGTMRSDYAVTDKYLFREYAAGGPATGQIDRRNQECWYFKITKNPGGHYYIQSYPGLAGFNENDDEFAGGDTPGAPVLFDFPADSKYIDWDFIPIDNVDLDEYAAYGKAFELYSARLRLYDMLCEAELYGADTSAAGAVYNNDNSTSEQIDNAVEALRPLVREALLVYGVKNSKPDSPIALTKYVLNNPDFASGNANGWKFTPGIGQNQGYQANQVYENTVDGIRIEQFIEAWRPAPALLSDGLIYQTVKGLPSGHYILECDGIARNATSEDDDENYVDPDEYRGAYLYYTDGTVVNHSASTLCDKEIEDEDGNYVRVPSHFTFEFDIQEVDSINIGLMFDDSNLTWVAADNFRLSIAGPSQALPSYVGLTSEVKTVEKLLGNDSEAQQTLIDAVAEALAEAKQLTDAASDKGKDSQYTAAYNKLHNARLALQTSIEAYKRAEAFIAQMQKDAETYSGKVYASLNEQLTEKREQMLDAYENRTLSTDDINAAISGYRDFLKTGIKAIFDEIAGTGSESAEPLDISILFDNMEYEYGTTQTAFAGGYPATNPVWMNETGTGNFKTNYGTAEVWDVKPFHIYRDFANLPKGKYSIETRAFVRIGSNDENYAQWQSGDLDSSMEYVYVYAGNSHSPLCNVAELALTDDYPTGSAALETADGTLYVPNQQASAYEIFTYEKYAELGAKTDVAASSVVATDGGTLHVGIVGTDNLPAGHWVVWHGWRLLYHGVSGSALDEALAQLILQAQELNAILVTAAQDHLDAAIQLGENALDGTDSEAKNNAIEALNQALEYAARSGELTDQIMDMYIKYTARQSELEGEYSDTTLPEILGKIGKCIEKEVFESNEQIENWLAELKIAFTRYLLSDKALDLASADAPGDITQLVENADFSVATTANRTAPEGWNLYLSSQTGNVQSNNGGYEAWHTGVASLSQDIYLLRDGLYRLTADAIYRFNDETSCTSALANGDAPIVEGYLYAAEDTVPVYFWLDETQTCASPEEAAELGLSGNTYTLNGRVLTNHVIVAPNSGAQVQTFFNGGRYNSVTVEFAVTEATPMPVTIGFYKTDTYPNSWIYVDNVHLYYLGNDGTGLADIVSDDRHRAAQHAIFTLDGRRSSRLVRGINIVRHADGSICKILH
ncbi:MAG: hypothetical protein IJT19_04855 [Bacteroidaceae bacterium]|nr:hypothetical protein [Bacteroidaceae bacterium]